MHAWNTLRSYGLHLLLFLTGLQVIPAATINVCDETSLRDALAGGGTLTFVCDGTITLTNTLVISQSVMMDATGYQVVLSGGNAVRPFVIQPGVTLALRNLTIADGYALGTNGNTSQPGGSGEGGGVYNNGGTLVAIGCVFLRHRAQGGTGGPGPQLGGAPGPGTGGAGRGGVVYNAAGGHVTASNCQFMLCQALGGTAGTGSSGSGGDAFGGVIYDAGGVVQVTDCVVLSNSVVSGRGQRLGGLGRSGTAYGGAIVNSGGQVALSRVVVSSNASISEYLNAAYGGAFHHAGGMSALTECRLAGNRAVAGRGLGIGTPSGLPGGHAFGGAASALSGILQISGTAFDHNLAVGGAEPGGGSPAGSAQGGAIYSNGEVEIANSTLAANEAQSGMARPVIFLHGRAFGGALCNIGGSLSLSHVTIASNAASHSGGGAVGYFTAGGIFSTNGSTELRDSIVSYNLSGSNCVGSLMDNGHNISSDASCNFTAPGSLNNTDPVLGPLADYGGPTPTMALLAGSPAIDAADTSSCPATDQRGIARPFGAGCDIGAFESSPPYTILGRVTGYLTSPDGIQLAAGSSSNWIDGSGNFALHGLSTGNYLVTPSSLDAVFVLSNRLVNLGPDAVGINFHSYRSNALSIEQIAVGAVRAVFASEAGQTFRVDVSQDASAWSPYSTNATETSGLFEFWDTNSAVAQPRLFRVLKP